MLIFTVIITIITILIIAMIIIVIIIIIHQFGLPNANLGSLLLVYSTVYY